MLEDARAVALLQWEQCLPDRLEYLLEILEHLTTLVTAAATLADDHGKAT